MTDLRTAAQQALEALEGVITDLRAAKAESERDWSLLEATQESLREHMAEVQRLRAALAQPATIAEWWAAKQAASGEPFGYLWPTGMHPEFRFYQQKRDGVDGMPLYATAQPAPAPECDSPNLCAVNGACAGQYGTKKQCATAQPAPARVPLTDEQINQITAEQWGKGLGAPYAAYRAYARAIEAAHGITAKEA